jgi:hypothetical protein
MRHRRLVLGTLTSLSSIAALMTGVAATPAAAQTTVPCDAGVLDSDVTSATPGTVLVLAPHCTYSLSKELDVTTSITILGNGATLTHASTAPASRIIYVHPGADLYLSRATVSNGNATGDFGGGIRNDGNLTVVESRIINNTADYSGGIGTNTGATTAVVRSVVGNNTAGVDGGGLDNSGSLLIKRSVIAGNTTGNLGGGVANTGTLRVLESKIQGNSASGASGTGGGLANFTVSSPNTNATLVNSGVFQNTATNSPGGIYDNGAAITLFRTAVVNNQPSNCTGSPTTVPDCAG